MRRTLVVPLVIVVALIGAGVSFLFPRGEASFPDLSPGVYVGTFRAEEQDVGTPLVLDVLSGASEVLVSAGDSVFPAQRRVFRQTPSGMREPLTIAGGQRELRFVGRVGDGGVFEGWYADSATGRRGSWSVRKVDVPPLAPGTREELSAWVSSWDALQVVEKKIEEMTGALASGEKRMKTLESPTVSAPTSSRGGASTSAGGTESREAILSHNETLRRKLETLQRDVDVARRVSAEGRLVALSRESVQREGRWIEQVLKLTAPALPGSFEDSYEHAQRVQALLDQIAHERGIMRNLLEGAPDERTPGERAQEEEFYSGLQ